MNQTIAILFLSTLVVACDSGDSGGEGENDSDAGAGSDAAPYDGTLTGTFDGAPFVPRFGVGAPREPVAGFTYELQFSDTVALSCDSRLRSGAGNELGLYIRAQLAAPEPGTYEAFIEYAELAAGGTRQRGGAGTVTITEATADRLSGSIAFERETDDAGTIDLGGEFTVFPCAE